MRALLIGLALLLTACVTTISVKTPREGVAACYKGVETALNTAKDIKNRGKLSPGTEVAIIGATDDARTSCDMARAALAAGNPVGANTALQIAAAVLLQIEAVLSEAK